MSRSGLLGGFWVSRSGPLKGCFGFTLWSLERSLGVTVRSLGGFWVARSDLLKCIAVSRSA